MAPIIQNSLQKETIEGIIFFAEQEFGDIWTVGDTNDPNVLKITNSDDGKTVAVVRVRMDGSIVECITHQDGKEVTHRNLSALVEAWMPV